MIHNLAKIIKDDGGDIIPLIIPGNVTRGMGLMNPSIYKDGNDFLLNMRWVDYTLFHSDKKQKYWSRWGPLTYVHPENLMVLKTINYLCKLDPNSLEIKHYAEIDTSKLDTPPVWEFHGLEDARLVRWEGKLYGIGVRRDVKTNGEGRMQYQELDFKFKDGCGSCAKAEEVSRNRIQPPIHLDSYCEKNWMPIVDMPHHFVKWTNPTEIVKADLSTNSTSQVHVGEKFINIDRDLRGGTQVIKWGDGWLTVTHELAPVEHKNELGLKDAFYFSRFVYWDSNWNITKTSSDFSFLDGRIEFTTGLCEYDNDFVLITFGWGDCAAYVAKVRKELINNLLTQTW